MIQMVAENPGNIDNENLLSSDESTASTYTLAMLARILSVPQSTLRRWYLRGLLIPTRKVNRLPYFDFTQVVAARNLARLISGSSSSQVIERQLTRLSKTRSGWQSNLADLDVVVDGVTVLVREKDERLVDAFGQFRLDFYSEEYQSDGDAVLKFSPTPEAKVDSQEPESLDELLQAALEFEDNQNPAAAIDVYRRMMQTFGPTADSAFALAEVFYAAGDLVAARERYYLAVELDDGFIEARANLGCVLVELCELEAARAEFEKALRIHPDYPDVHFHLAKLLDQMDQELLAIRHWERFLELAPRTPWSDEARERLGRTSN
jgi:tetratricopeptide (TPR) repeat protein